MTTQAPPTVRYMNHGDHFEHARPSTPGASPDRSKWRRSLARAGLLAWAMVCACRTMGSGVAEGATAAPVERWVDERAAAEGDGTMERPWRRLPKRLEGSSVWHLKSGVYAGPVVMGEGVELRGEGLAVISIEGEGVVLRVEGTGRLSQLSIQGGSVGLSVSAKLSAQDVHVSGQKTQAVVVEGAELDAVGLKLVATIPGGTGLAMNGTSTVTLARVELEGGFRRGIDNQGGTLTVSGLVSRGGGYGVRAVGGLTKVTNASFSGGKNSAVFASQGVLEVTQLKVSGHDNAVELGSKAKATITELNAGGLASSGVSSNDADLTLRRATITGSGPGGAVFIAGGTAHIVGLHVHDVSAIGVLARKATLRLESAIFERIRSEPNGDGTSSLGDALQLRASTVSFTDVKVSDVAGSALYASATAKVMGQTITCERAAGGAVVSERGAEVNVDRLVVKGSAAPALSVPDAARATIGRLFVVGSSQSIWADCQLGARVDVGQMEADDDALFPRCVQVGVASAQ